MDLSGLKEGEQNPVYQQVATANNARHYDFLHSMISAAISSNRTWLSQSLIKAINFHAIVGLHHEAGQYRSHGVEVGKYKPPPYFRVEPLMDEFVNHVNWSWQSADASRLAAYALWRINNIHPFVNGNGRTARAVCYFILCVKSGGLLPGPTILPEILRNEPVREIYVAALGEGDNGNLGPLDKLIRKLVSLQVKQSG